MFARYAQHGDALAGPLHYGIGLEVIGGLARLFQVDIGAQPGEFRSLDHVAQAVLGVVIVVVAHGGRRVAQQVHHGHGGQALGQRALGGALEGVAGVEQYDGILLLLHQGGEGGETAYDAGGIFLVPFGGPGEVPAVYVAGVVHGDGQGPGRGRQEKQHREH